MSTGRNHDRHTSVDRAEANIIDSMLLGPRCALLMSALGRAAFPYYRFKNPQGAALAVSRIARGMLDRGLLIRAGRGYALNTLSPEVRQAMKMHLEAPKA